MTASLNKQQDGTNYLKWQTLRGYSNSLAENHAALYTCLAAQFPCLSVDLVAAFLFSLMSAPRCQKRKQEGKKWQERVFAKVRRSDDRSSKLSRRHFIDTRSRWHAGNLCAKDKVVYTPGRLIGGGDVQLRSFLTSTLHCNCQHLISAASPLGKGPWHPLNWKLTGPQCRCGLRAVLKPRAPGMNCHRVVFYLDCLTLEDGTDGLSGNVSN
jgi:hypothetical protein